MTIRLFPIALKLKAFSVDTSLLVIGIGKKSHKKDPRAELTR